MVRTRSAAWTVRCESVAEFPCAVWRLMGVGRPGSRT